MYRFDDEPNFASFARALKAGNPAAIVAFNPGVKIPVVSHTRYDDYTAGEINLPELARAAETCPGRWLEREGHKAQYHILSYLGTTWCGGDRPQLPDERVVACTRQIAAKGGVVTYDVPIQKSGLIPRPFVEQLRAVPTAVRGDPLFVRLADVVADVGRADGRVVRGCGRTLSRQHALGTDHVGDVVEHRQADVVGVNLFQLVIVVDRPLTIDDDCRLTPAQSGIVGHLAVGACRKRQQAEKIARRQRHLPDHIRWVKFASIAWAGEGFFYTRYPEPGTVAAGDEQQNQNSGALNTIKASISKLAGLRHQVQLAAEQAFPWRTPGVAATRQAFLLPPDRPLPG